MVEYLYERPPAESAYLWTEGLTGYSRNTPSYKQPRLDMRHWNCLVYWQPKWCRSWLTHVNLRYITEQEFWFSSSQLGSLYWQMKEKWKLIKINTFKRCIIRKDKGHIRSVPSWRSYRLDDLHGYCECSRESLERRLRVNDLSIAVIASSKPFAFFA